MDVAKMHCKLSKSCPLPSPPPSLSLSCGLALAVHWIKVFRFIFTWLCAHCMYTVQYTHTNKVCIPNQKKKNPDRCLCPIRFSLIQIFISLPDELNFKLSRCSGAKLSYWFYTIDLFIRNKWGNLSANVQLLWFNCVRFYPQMNWHYSSIQTHAHNFLS